MKIMVVKEFTFDAAHSLPEHPGKCKGLHGHTYKLQVGFRGEPDPHTGMVIDFGTIKKVIEERIINKLDHKHLNDLAGLLWFPIHSPTAEKMIEWIAETLWSIGAEAREKLCFIRLYETPTSYAEWRVD